MSSSKNFENSHFFKKNIDSASSFSIIFFQTIRTICSTGAGNAGCGVTSGSTGSKELHYVLRALAPAACQHSKLFIEACQTNMRIALPAPSSRRTCCNQSTGVVYTCHVLAARTSTLFQSVKPLIQFPLKFRLTQRERWRLYL